MKDQFSNWPKHFRHSLETAIWPPVPEEYALSFEERKAIEGSIQQFQAGESSEGKHLIASATKWALKTGNPGYAAAMQLFIREENHHAKMLSLWMAGQGIPNKSGHWTDKAFTLLRRLAGIEMTISVLLTAELIAAGYYLALREATDSQGLKQVCDRILKDEQHHIRFQSQALAAMTERQSVFRKWANTHLRKFLLQGTCIVVWAGHRKVYKRAGWNFFQMRSQALAEFEQSLLKIRSFRKEIAIPRKLRSARTFVYLAQFTFKSLKS